MPEQAKSRTAVAYDTMRSATVWNQEGAHRFPGVAGEEPGSAGKELGDSHRQTVGDSSLIRNQTGQSRTVAEASAKGDFHMSFCAAPDRMVKLSIGFLVE